MIWGITCTDLNKTAENCGIISPFVSAFAQALAFMDEVDIWRARKLPWKTRGPHASGNQDENFAEDDLWEGLIWSPNWEAFYNKLKSRAAFPSDAKGRGMESLSIEKSRKAKLGIRSHFLSLVSEWSQNLGKTEFSGTCLRRSSDLISRQELGAWQIGLISLRSKYVLCTYTEYTQTNQLRTALRLN